MQSALNSYNSISHPVFYISAGSLYLSLWLLFACYGFLLQWSFYTFAFCFLIPISWGFFVFCTNFLFSLSRTMSMSDTARRYFYHSKDRPWAFECVVPYPHKLLWVGMGWGWILFKWYRTIVFLIVWEELRNNIFIGVIDYLINFFFLIFFPEIIPKIVHFYIVITVTIDLL